MLDYISGEIASLTPATVVIDNNGIGYELNITLLDYSQAEGESHAKFYVHESIREDAHVLYGFLGRRERELFRLLIGVSGVGPNTARLILSSLTADMLEDAIASGNDSALKSVKGIGGKTAQRIIVDLRDKINASPATLSVSPGSGSGQTFEETVAALTVLGFSPQQSRTAVRKLLQAEPALSTEEAVRRALKLL